MRITVSVPFLYAKIASWYEDVTGNGKFVVFFHHLNRLHKILQYIDRNEVGRHIYLVHCNNNEEDRPHRNSKKFKELTDKVLPALKRAGVYTDFKIEPVFIDEPFGPQAIETVAKKYKVRRNRVLIGSIHHEHPFDYDDLGGARIIF